MGSLTGRNVEHIPVILFWGHRRTLFGGNEGLEQPDGGTVNIAGNESYPDALNHGQALQIADESVSFPLHGPDLGRFHQCTKSKRYLVATSGPVVILMNAIRHTFHPA